MFRLMSFNRYAKICEILSWLIIAILHQQLVACIQ